MCLWLIPKQPKVRAKTKGKLSPSPRPKSSLLLHSPLVVWENERLFVSPMESLITKSKHCKVVLESKKKKTSFSTSSMFVNQINYSPYTSWIVDIRCGFYICSNMQKL